MSHCSVVLYAQVWVDCKLPSGIVEGSWKDHVIESFVSQNGAEFCFHKGVVCLKLCLREERSV